MSVLPLKEGLMLVQTRMEAQSMPMRIAVYQDKPGLCMHVDANGKAILEKHFGPINVNPKTPNLERYRQEGVRLGVEVVGPQEILVFKDQSGVGLFIKMKNTDVPVWAWQRAGSLIKNYKRLATQGMAEVENIVPQPDGSLRVHMTKAPIGVRTQDRLTKGKKRPVSAAKAARQKPNSIAPVPASAPKLATAPAPKPAQRKASDIVARLLIDVYGTGDLIDREINLFEWLYIKKQLSL